MVIAHPPVRLLFAAAAVEASSQRAQLGCRPAHPASAPTHDRFEEAWATERHAS